MTESVVDYSEQPLAVEVDDVTMIFNMASESLTNLKEYFIKLAKHELFFEEFRALKHISFDIHRGEVVGLVGTNGSGKSTMLKIIAGVLEPSEGSVKVHGNIAPLIELGAGFDPELTARDNICLVDETLSVGDVFFQQKCEDRIHHFIQSGDVTVLFVSHSMEQVERICQRAVWIEKGDLRMDGPVDEVCKAYREQFN